MTAAISWACCSKRSVTTRAHSANAASRVSSSSARGSSDGRHRCEHVLGDDAGVHAVHAAVGVADAHRRERVAVVAAADREEPRPAGARLRLPRHLHRHLDRDGPGVGEEDVGEPGQLDETPTELHGRLVGEPAEHHVAHPADLVADGGVELRYGVPVDRAPPRAHRVDDLDLAAVPTKPESHALGGDDLVHQRGGGRGGVRVPQVVPVPREEVMVSRRSLLSHRGSSRARRRWPSTRAGSPAPPSGDGTGRRTGAAPSSGALRSPRARPRRARDRSDRSTSPPPARHHSDSLSALIGIFRSSSRARSSSGSRPRVVR